MRSSGRPALYGLDIETDTSCDGLDPSVARVVAVALSSAYAGEVVLTGSEAGVLAALDSQLATMPAGVIVTWNGGAFDLPFLAARAAVAGLHLGLELAWDPGASRPGRLPLPGALGTCVARWYGHSHLDAYRAWRESLAGSDEPCGLKAVARSEGLVPVDVDDVTMLHNEPLADLRRYVSSDAALARQLAEGRWGAVRRFVDRLPAGGQLAFA